MTVTPSSDAEASCGCLVRVMVEVGVIGTVAVLMTATEAESDFDATDRDNVTKGCDADRAEMERVGIDREWDRGDSVSVHVCERDPFDGMVSA